jgi:uncharacterized membrane protein
MDLSVKIIIAALLLWIVITVIVLSIPYKSDEIAAIAESGSAIATTASIIILIVQNRKTAKQNTETIIRSEWAILHAERQRLESDVTQCRIVASSEVRGAREQQLKDRIDEISAYMTEMLGNHRAIFPNLAYFTLPDKPNKEQQTTHIDT